MENTKETAFYVNGCSVNKAGCKISLATYVVQREGDDFAAKVRYSNSSSAGTVHIDAVCTFVPVGAIDLEGAKPIAFDALPDSVQMAYRGALRERGTVRVVKPTNPTTRFLDFCLNGVVGPIELGPLDIIALAFERRRTTDEVDPMGYVTLSNQLRGTDFNYQSGPDSIWKLAKYLTGDPVARKRAQFASSKPTSTGTRNPFRASMPGVKATRHYNPDSYPGRCYAAAENLGLPYPAVYAVDPKNAQALNAVWQSETFQRKARDMSEEEGILRSDNPETIRWGLLNLFAGYRCITDKLSRVQDKKRAWLADAIVKHFGGEEKK